MNYNDVIGVKMNSEDSISSSGISLRETADKIAAHVVSSRPGMKVQWRPYIVQEGVTYEGICSNIAFDAKAFYPYASEGDFVYTGCNIELEKDFPYSINIIGAAEVFLDGKCLFSSWEQASSSEKTGEYVCIPLNLHKGDRNRLVIKCVCTDGNFGFKLNISPPRCASLWASFYLCHANVTLPISGLEKEEGIAVSKLFTGNGGAEAAYLKKTDFIEHEEYVYPKKEEKNLSYDFNEIYKDGKCAFAVTYAKRDCRFNLSAFSRTKLIVNGQTAKRLENGQTAEIALKKGDMLLLKSRKEDKWGFKTDSCDAIGIDFLDTERKDDFAFLTCGPFFQDSFDVKLPPEYAEDIMRPFRDGKGKLIFWKFGSSYVRGYLNSSFFGQWYYATMLSLDGVCDCGICLDKAEYVDYFINAVEFLADFYSYAVYDNDRFGMSSFMCSVKQNNALDNIGTMGASFIKAYRITGDEKYLCIIKELKEHIRLNVPRFEDRTFCRRGSGTMWADDFYMSGTFLADLYSEFGDEESLSDIICQNEGFRKRLFIPGEKIYSHIFFMDNEEQNRIPWGRGNGWILMSMSKTLALDGGKSKRLDPVRKSFTEFCGGLLPLQDDEGFWHQVLNDRGSYRETSCTAMFALSFLRGVKLGLLGEEYLESAVKAARAITGKCIDSSGILYGVCMGSSCSMDKRYYMELPTVKDDNHGTGIVLTLLCKIMEYQDTEGVEIL